MTMIDHTKRTIPDGVAFPDLELSKEEGGTVACKTWPIEKVLGKEDTSIWECAAAIMALYFEHLRSGLNACAVAEKLRERMNIEPFRRVGNVRYLKGDSWLSINHDAMISDEPIIRPERADHGGGDSRSLALSTANAPKRAYSRVPLFG